MSSVVNIIMAAFNFPVFLVPNSGLVTLGAQINLLKSASWQNLAHVNQAR